MLARALIFLLLAPFVAAGPVIADPETFVLEDWSIEGDRLLDRGDALDVLPAAPGDSVTSATLTEAADVLRRRLVSAGWWSATVASERRGAIGVLRLEAGEPVIVGAIDVRGNLLFAREEILARVDLRPGRPFVEATFREDVSRILRAYSEHGYPLARVYPSGFRRTENGRLGFDLRIGEGPRTEIESIRVFGDTRTSERVIARIGGVRPGDTWNVARIEKMASRLRRDGLFTRVGEPRIVKGSRASLVGVEIELEEGRSSTFFGVLGYNQTPQGKGVLVGILDLSLRNILGTARRGSFRFERQAENIQDLAFRYREPWLLGSSISVEVGAAQSLRDTLYSRTDLDAALTLPIQSATVVSFAAERRSSTFDDVDGTSVSETSTGGSIGLRVDLRDRSLNPSRGGRADLKVGVRETKQGELRTRLETEAQILVPFGSRGGFSQVGGFRGVETTADEVPLYEQYFLGGTKTVRGYREEQFNGDRVGWSRSELRYRLSTRSRAYGFGDMGGYRFEVAPGTAPGRVESDVIAGYGLGAALETRGSGVVRVELALGKDDDFSEAKVHVGLEQEF